MIDILFFGPVAERMGTGRLQVAHRPGMQLGQLRDELRAAYPEAFALVSLAAVDGEHVRDDTRLLEDGGEVVFMSRFSGG
jgi:molybdopterin converting factor small subunit